MRTKFAALLALSLTALLAFSVEANSAPQRGGESHARVASGKSAKASKSAADRKKIAGKKISKKKAGHSAKAKQQAMRGARAETRPMAAIVRPVDDGDAGVPHTSISASRHRPMFGWPALVTEARKYLGTNPTKRSKLWCATFMNMVLARVGYPGTGSDAARSFASYGRRINEPRIGAIAVLTRGKNGGHVGIVTGIDSTGNPIIISGNHGRKVGVGTYARSRVIAYVMPTGDPSPTRFASLSGAASAPRLADTPRGNVARNDEGGLPSPISELLAAINAEEPGAGRAAPRPQQVQQARQEARPEPQRPVQQIQPPQQPQRVVQQMAGNETVQVNFVRPLPPAHQARAAAPSSRRDLPLDPALARFLGVRQR